MTFLSAVSIDLEERTQADPSIHATTGGAALGTGTRGNFENEDPDEEDLRRLCLDAVATKPTLQDVTCSSLICGFHEPAVEDAYQASLTETRCEIVVVKST
jgi:hypothetical protein